MDFLAAGGRCGAAGGTAHRAGDEAETNRLRAATYGGKLLGSKGFVEEAQTVLRDIDDSELGRPDKDSTPEAGKREGERRWGLAGLE